MRRERKKKRKGGEREKKEREERNRDTLRKNGYRSLWFLLTTFRAINFICCSYV